MKIYHQLVFDDAVEGTTTVYTNPDWNELLATTEVIVIQVYATQSGGTNPTLTVSSEVSGDARNWTALQATPEINAQTLNSPGLTSLAGFSPATSAVPGFRRLAITLGGTTPATRLRVFVTGRQVVPASVLDYIWLKRGGSAQTGIGNGTKIDLNTTGLIRGLTYDSANSALLLNPGKVYSLTLSGWLDNFSLADGLVDMKFVDDANNPLSNPTGDSPTARFRPMTGTTQAGQSSGCQMLYVVPSGATITARTVKIRVTNASGTADVPQNGVTLIAEEVPGGA